MPDPDSTSRCRKLLFRHTAHAAHKSNAAHIASLRLSTLSLVGAIAIAIIVVAAELLATHTARDNWGDLRENELNKIAAMEQISAAIGYGGVIHNLKNYVLRKDPEFYARFCRACEHARTGVDLYRLSPKISSEELSCLSNIESLIASYEESFSRIYARDLSPSELDQLAKVDDEPFFKACETLRATIDSDYHSATDAFRAELDSAFGLMAIIGLAGITGFAIVGFVLAKNLRRFLAAHIEELNRHIEQRENASHSKSLFLANMSHEIRTPMTAIIGFTEILGAIERNPESNEAIDAIKENADHLQSLINNILDFSKIEEDKLELERLPVSLSETIDQVVTIIRPLALKQGTAITHSVSDALPERIISDPTRLRQIILNLASNAVKFTENGEVTITADQESRTDTLLISVRDTGIGMTPSQRDLIARFDAFTQADNTITRSFGGSGLGLQIAHSLTRLLSGDIDVQSKSGVGTTFTVSLPLIPASAHSPAPAREPSAQSHTEPPCGLAGTRLLVAEDSPYNQRLFTTHLENANAAVDLATTGREAVRLVSALEPEEQYDVILMDIQMPDMDGIEATQRLREMGCETPIIALSAHAVTEIRDACLSAGFDAFITKPIRRDELLRTVRQHCRRGPGARAA